MGFGVWGLGFGVWGLGSSLTYLRLVSCTNNYTTNMIYKTVLLIMAAAAYITWMTLTKDFSSHRSMEVIGMFTCMVARSLCLIELLADSKDGASLKRAANNMQVVSYTCSMAISAFYWMIQARGRLAGSSTAALFVKVLVHAVSPLMAFVPVCCERSEFRHWLLWAVIVPAGLAYLGFVWIWTAVSGECIYKELSFENWLTLAFAVTALAMVISFYYFGMGISRLVDKRFLSLNSKAANTPSSPFFVKQSTYTCRTPDLESPVNKGPGINNKLTLNLKEVPGTLKEDMFIESASTLVAPTPDSMSEHLEIGRAHV